MKTLYPKPGKGKIHPSPPPPPPSSPAGDPTAAALRLLPAAILALTAALRPEDRQVLAYLVTRSLQGAAPPPPDQRGRRRRPHPPAIGCDCFDCYTSFWSRWDCSPDRELIHVAIDAFEDHLAAAESSSSPSSYKRRDKGKRKPPPPPSSPKPPEPEPADEAPEAASPPTAPPSPPPAATSSESDDEKFSEISFEAEGEEMEERKRGWADVMGILNRRLWGIWSPAAVESAT